MSIRKGDTVLIKEGVFTSFIGVVKGKQKDGKFIITLKYDYNIEKEKVPITIQIQNNQLKKIVVLDDKNLRLYDIE